MMNNWNAAWRAQALPELATRDWDLIVVGGGISGAGILREAARRGWTCLLLEQRDFAWGTSSRSSKMVHGGLRYIAKGQFGLTRDSVRERERLLWPQHKHGLRAGRGCIGLPGEKCTHVSSMRD